MTRRRARVMVAAAATAALPAVALAALDLPKLKPGLWQMTTASARAPSAKTTSTLCVDAAIQQDMLRIGSGMMVGLCSKSDFRTIGNKFVGEAVCNVGGSTMRSRSTMTMNGDTSYRAEAEATFDPPFNGQTSTRTIIDGHHIGACKPGQQPGDLTMPGGQTINIRNVLGSGVLGGRK
jgi:hypothetical protein